MIIPFFINLRCYGTVSGGGICRASGVAGSVVGQTGLERVDTVMLHRCGSSTGVEESVASTLLMTTDPYHLSPIFDSEWIIYIVWLHVI